MKYYSRTQISMGQKITSSMYFIRSIVLVTFNFLCNSMCFLNLFYIEIYSSKNYKKVNIIKVYDQMTLTVIFKKI